MPTPIAGSSASLSPARIDRDGAVPARRQVSERPEVVADLRNARDLRAQATRRPSIRTLDAADRHARTREREDVRPHRVHVLVDPELLLSCLIRIVRASADALRPLVQ